MKAFADKVKDARISLGMSQTQLAQEVGVSSRSVQAYESGEKKPRQAMMAKLAKALKVSIRFLSDDECEDLQAEEEDYRDNMPENLQGSEKYEKADEACDNLSEAVDNLEEVISSIEAAIE